MNLLLLSNSSSDAGYLAHALADIRELIAGLPAGAPAVFVPFAGVTRGWDDYTAMVGAALADTGLDVQPLHRRGPAGGAGKRRADHRGRRQHLQSAGTAAAPGPARRRGAARAPGHALSGLERRFEPGLPEHLHDQRHAHRRSGRLRRAGAFQINPHYTNAHPPGHRGETRAQRLAEFCVLNPSMPVLGLPEGSALRVRGDVVTLLGPHEAPLFLGQQEPRVYAPGALELPA